jgi:crotonobetainyl-CoA:carnitine CoA-transferase CaiB-like acyl-CoA transferase
MRLLGLEDVLDDPDYAQVPEVFPTRAALDRLLTRVRAGMRARPMAEWLDLFDREDVGADPFFSPREFLHSDQARATGRAVRVDDPRVGPTWQIGPLAVLSETPAQLGRPAAAPGEHTNPLAGAAERESRSRRAQTAPVSGRRYPLEGVTAIEAGYAYAAPFGLTLLAEMGARVIKVEGPTGDLSRRNWLTYYGKEYPGKESVIADLKAPEGREIVHRLAARADIFLHNFRPGVPERLGIDYATLGALNPRLIYVYGSCYGATGPWAHKPGFHSTANAISGSGVVEGGRGNPPLNRTYGDPTGALATSTATLLALLARERTGRGQYVETTMLASLAYAVSAWGLDYADKPPDPELSADLRGVHALRRLYPTREGWLLLACRDARDWDALRRALGEPAALAEARFGDEAGRHRADTALQERLASLLTADTAAAWEARCRGEGVPAARADGIDHFDFMLNHPHMRANGLSIEDDLPGIGRFWRSAGCAEFSDLETRHGACEPLGASTAKILRELGYDDGAIAALEAGGVTRALGHGLAGVR